jgi:hypothetical protein
MEAPMTKLTPAEEGMAAARQDVRDAIAEEEAEAARVTDEGIFAIRWTRFASSVFGPAEGFCTVEGHVVIFDSRAAAERMAARYTGMTKSLDVSYMDVEYSPADEELEANAEGKHTAPTVYHGSEGYEKLMEATLRRQAAERTGRGS